MRAALSVVSSVSLVFLACTQAPAPSAPAPSAQAPVAAQSPLAPQSAPALTPEQLAARNDSLQKDRTMHVNEVLALIKGKEELPAEQVYKNIQIFKGRTAAQLLNAMNRGFSSSLGVSCSHCHVSEYDSEAKPTKQIARDMVAMVSTINGTLLKNIPNLKSPNPGISCGTCHNGRPRPGAGGGAQPPQPRPSGG